MKRNWLRVFVIMTLLMAALPLAGLPAAGAADTVTIGLSLANSEDPFLAGVQNGAEVAAEEMGVHLLVMSAENDPEIELANIQSMIDQGAEAILLNPVAVESSAAVAAANAAGVPVVWVGAHLDAAGLDAELASVVTVDARQGGWLAGALLCESLGNTATVIKITGDAEDLVATGRSLGFDAYVAESCPELTVVTFDAAGMDRDSFVGAFADQLRAQETGGVVAMSEALTLASVEASIIARRGGITFIGFDTSDDALSALQQGRLYAMILPVGWIFGETAIQASTDLLNGKEVDSAIYVNLGVLDLETIVRGGPGSGQLEGDPRSGQLEGDPRSGQLEGGPGSGQLEGGPGSGQLEGGPGSGQLEGGPGSGQLEGGPGSGQLEGGPGSGQLEGETTE